MSGKPAQDRVTMERVYRASLEDVWELWTTAEGIESWWGPPGFAVKVRSIDLRPGGELRYAMSAVTPEMVAFMKQSGMPATTEHRATYTEVVPRRRLAYLHLVDFVPGHAPYDVAHLVELRQAAEGVRMTLTFDRMHDEEWTKRAVMGWELELGKLEGRIAARARQGVRP